MVPAIRAENLSKRYRVNHADARGRYRYRMLREELIRLASAPVRRLRNGAAAGRTEEFWALRDIDFEVQAGEILGVIGRNGAGKSTLLKILSRITEPTTGRVELRGRVGSLLEVGTGFHPELAGRENIFLNGAILGMSRREIQRKFDEIVEFAGIEQFIDTPVKRYSSGMYVRLAFAVAAHLDPDILLIDEVLAVGDMNFQRKCLGKMEQVASSGRTVLFVSHNMAAIQGLCRRGLVIESGRLAFDGNQTDATRFYSAILDSSVSQGQYRADECVASTNGDGPKILSAYLTSDSAYGEGAFPTGAPLEFRVTCFSPEPITNPAVGIGIDNSLGQRIVSLHSAFGANSLQLGDASGTFQLRCAVNDLALAPGEYRVRLSLQRNGQRVHLVEDAFRFEIVACDFYDNGGKFGRGVVLCHQDWQLIK